MSNKTTLTVPSVCTLSLITWQKRNYSLFGVFLSSINWKFVKDSHLQKRKKIKK